MFAGEIIDKINFYLFDIVVYAWLQNMLMLIIFKIGVTFQGSTFHLLKIFDIVLYPFPIL